MFSAGDLKTRAQFFETLDRLLVRALRPVASVAQLLAAGEQLPWSGCDGITGYEQVDRVP